MILARFPCRNRVGGRPLRPFVPTVCQFAGSVLAPGARRRPGHPGRIGVTPLMCIHARRLPPQDCGAVLLLSGVRLACQAIDERCQAHGVLGEAGEGQALQGIGGSGNRARLTWVELRQERS